MMYDTCRYDVSIHLEQAGEQLEDVTATTGIHHGEITRQTGSFYDFELRVRKRSVTKQLLTSWIEMAFPS